MYSKYLIHYNHNHDRLGRFARSAGSAGSKVGSAVLSSGKKKKKQQPPKADIKKGKAANTKLSDKERKRIVESGDAREVAKNKDRLSTRELETAVTRLQKEKVQRIDLEKKLSDLSDGGKQRQTAIEKIEKYGSDLERISNGLEKAAKMYNTAAKIHNLVSSGNDQWPIYGEKKKADKKKEKTKQEEDWARRGNDLKELNLHNKEREAKQKQRELDDIDRKYEESKTKEKEEDRQSKIRIQPYNSDNEESSYYSDKIYDYAADGEGKYYTEREYEKKKKLRHSDLVDLGEDWLMHYNHNHDKLGRFARSIGIGGRSSSSKTSKTSSDNKTSNEKSIYDYSGPEQSFLERDERIIKLRQEQYEMQKIKNDTKRKKEALRINNEINRTAAEVIKDYTPPVETEAHYTDSKPLDFQKSSTVGESIAKINYGKNPKCGVVIDGGSKQLANELVRDPKIEKMFREYAADSNYPYRLDEYKDTSYDDYKNSLVCQQITVHEPEDAGNDVTCWYGEQPDGPGEMMYYDSKKKKIIGSEYYR